jgi:hypothetical protein
MTRGKRASMRQVTISSAHGGQLMSQPGNTTLVLHWAVDVEDTGEWSRPPKQMLPPGTTYRHDASLIAPSGTLLNLCAGDPRAGFKRRRCKLPSPSGRMAAHR